MPVKSIRKFRLGLWAGVLVIFAWVATMVTLVTDYRGNKPTDSEISTGEFFGSVSPAEKWRDIEEWMLVVQAMDGGATRPIGASHTSIRRLDTNTSAAAYLAEFAMQGRLSPILPDGFVKGLAVLDSNETLTSFSVVAEFGPLKLSSMALVERDILYLKVDKGNDPKRYRRRLEQPVSFSEVLRPSLSRHMKIAPGEKMSSPVIDPLTGANRGTITVKIVDKEKIELGGESLQAFRVTSSLGDVTTQMWVDADGKTLRRNLVNKIRMDRTDRETALKHAGRLEEPLVSRPLDFGEFAGVPLTGEGKTEDEAGAPGLLGLILQ
jgi:hypothetical protein